MSLHVCMSDCAIYKKKLGLFSSPGLNGKWNQNENRHVIHVNYGIYVLLCLGVAFEATSTVKHYIWTPSNDIEDSKPLE